MSDTSLDPAPKPRIVVLRRQGADDGSRRQIRRIVLAVVATLALVVLGMALGFRGGAVWWTPPEVEGAVTGERNTLTERVNGGLYALEVATPAGQARWMLEFDAEIVTRNGPSNPQQLRDALEKLVIASTSMPVVNMDPDPTTAMRAAMLAMAAEAYPWLVDIHMRRSDIRAPSTSLSDIGKAMRNLGH